MITLYDEKVEQTVLGCLIQQSQKIAAVLIEIKPVYFYFAKNITIFESIAVLFSEGKRIDIVTLSEKLASLNKLEYIGGVAYIATIISEAFSFSHLPEYVEILKEKYKFRSTLETLDECSEDAKQGKFESSNDLICTVMNKAMNLSKENLREKIEIAENMQEFSQMQEDFAESIIAGNKCIGISTGFTSLDRIIDGYRPEHLITLTAYTSIGKCMAPGTKVLMHDGQVKKIDDILVGDKVMGPDSLPRNVLSLCGGIDSMYKIVPIYGEPFVVNGNHVLSLKRTGTYGDNVWNDRKGEVINISVNEYINSTKSFKHRHKLYRASVEFDEKALSIDPYFLGMWLGDGTSAGVAITNPDIEVEEFLSNYAKKLGMKLHIRRDKGCKLLAIVKKQRLGVKKNDCLLSELRNINVINNKHIPNNYKINSRANRLLLLAGLIDSDGSTSSDYFYDFSSVNKKLADDVEFLALSLGFRVTKKERNTITNFSNEKICTNWRLYISGGVWAIPTKIKRKKIAYRELSKNTMTSGFSVINMGKGEYKGFSLDGDHLFVLGNFFVNHNSTKMLNMAYQLLKQDKRVIIFSLEMSKNDMISKLLAIHTSLAPMQIMKGYVDNAIYEKQMSAKKWLSGKRLTMYSDLQDIDEILMAMQGEESKEHVDVFFLDYIQNITSTKKMDEYTLLTTGIKSLQALNRRLKTTLVVLSQMSNDSNKSTTTLNIDGKGTGAIKAASNVFIYMKRDVEKEEEVNQIIQEGREMPLLCIINKNRHGTIGAYKVNMHPVHGTIYEPY